MGYPPPPPARPGPGGPYHPGYGPGGYGAPAPGGPPPPPYAPPQPAYPPNGYAPAGYPQQAGYPAPQQAGYPAPQQGGYPQQQPPAQYGGAPADLYGSPILVYDQPAQFFSTEATYTIWSPQGQPAAHVREQGVSGAKKALRVVNQASQSKAERKLTIFRPDGVPYFHFYKPYGFMGTPKMQVLTAQGGLIGHLRKRAMRGWEILTAQEQQLGYYELLSGRVTDWQQQEVARIQRGFEGMGELLSQMFTGADRYVLRMHAPLQEPMRTLVLACPLAFDTAVSQNRSLGGWL
ncbi:LURP-one-related/scramblase family protein [Actinomadura napierensis]|uniref:Scramblase n=1 Tax=Actinomadura napierensis TaxID=267854 RepID=A0ABN2YHR0_9ACTN